jgi:hypothetical protein
MSLLWEYADYDPSSVASWSHWTLRPYDPTTPRPHDPMKMATTSKTCRGKIWSTFMKSTNSLTHLLVILKQHHTTIECSYRALLDAVEITNAMHRFSPLLYSI